LSGEAHRRRLRGLLRLAGIARAGDLTLVERAFVHESCARESGVASNERMEFLGDSVLGFVTAQFLYERYADEPEGMLTLRKAAIVNDAELASTARRLQFPSMLRLGTGLRTSGGAENTSVLADAFEAFVAAVFLRYGIEKTRRFLLAEHIEPVAGRLRDLVDPKTRLQHYAQENCSATPVYRDTSSGTPQQPSFESVVWVGDRALGTGTGPSKRAAQRAAATEALASLEQHT
jgi:ribonuclease III